MTRRLRAVVAILSLRELACGSGQDGTLGGPSDAAAKDDVTADAANAPDASLRESGTRGDGASRDASGDAASRDVGAEAASNAALSEGGADALSASTRDGGEGGAGSVDGGGSPADDAPYLGSMPTPATMGLLRLANWSPDSPSVDICIAPHGTSAFQGPLVAALARASQSDAGALGLAFPWVSAYTLVSPGQYDARIVVAGAGSCAVGVLHDETNLLPVAAGGAETVALVGEAAPPVGGYKLRLAGFLDDVTPAGAIGIRVINAAPELPQIDVGTGTLATKNFSPIFRGVPVGRTGPPAGAWIPFLVDANGYVANAALSNVSLSAHVTSTGDPVDGGPTDTVVSAAMTSAPAGTVVTIVVTGALGNTLIECIDNAGTIGPLSDCTVAGAAADGGM